MYREIICAYVQLDEYGHAFALMGGLLTRWPKDPWAASREFTVCYSFLSAYLSDPPAGGTQSGATQLKAADPRVAEIFRSLHERQPEAEWELMKKLIELRQDAVPDLISALTGQSSAEQRWAGDALFSIGEAALPMLCQRLSSLAASHREDDAAAAVRIVKFLREIKHPSIIPALRAALECKHGTVIGMAIIVLQDHPGGLDEDLLLRLTEHEESRARERAVMALGACGTEKTIRAFRQQLPTAYAEAAYQMRYAIWRIERRQGVAPGPQPRRAAGSKRWQGAERSLESPNPGIRIAALGAIAFRTDRLDDFLRFIKILEADTSPRVRVAAWEAVGKASRRVQLKCRRDPEAHSRFRAALHRLLALSSACDSEISAEFLDMPGVFAEYRDTELFSDFCRLTFAGMTSGDPVLRAKAIWTFTTLFHRDREAVPKYVTDELRGKLADAIVRTLDDERAEHRWAIVQAAELLKLTTARDQLLQIASGDDDHTVRSYAITALEVVGDESCVPVLARISTTDPRVGPSGLYSNREHAWQIIRKLCPQSWRLRAQ